MLALLFLWLFPHPYCHEYKQLLSHEPMNIGVRFDTRDPHVVAIFEAELDRLAETVALTWRVDQSHNCALEVRELPLRKRKANRQGYIQSGGAHIGGTRNFDGRLYYHPALAHQPDLPESFRHELGHLMGLQHNPSVDSIMYWLTFSGRGTEFDQRDLAALSQRHKLRESAQAAQLPNPTPISENMRAP
jgi:Matrixin